jgi:hypothetical protein
MEPLLLRSAIKRGLTLVTANWPIVPIDFAVDSFFKLALGFPIVGGALMVTTLLGGSAEGVLSEGLGPTADLVIGSLASAPAGLAAFLAAISIVAVGGEAVLFVVKAGTLSVLVKADRQAGEVHRVPIDFDSLRRARAFGLDVLTAAWGRFARRGVWLALGLGSIYVLVGAMYLGLVTWGLFGSDSRWAAAWSAVVVFATSAAVVIVAVANLAYTLLRVIIVTDDCSIRVACRRLLDFVVDDARQVIGIFAAIGGIELIAAAASLLATAGLAPLAYVPLASLVMLPLQAALWLLRGLLFEALSLIAVAAYLTQYRRFAEGRQASGRGLPAEPADVAWPDSPEA